MLVKELKERLEGLNENMPIKIQYDNESEVGLTEVFITAPDMMMIGKYLLLK